MTRAQVVAAQRELRYHVDVPDSRVHRGMHPQDAALFADAVHPVLRQAAAELSWLLGRGYKLESSLKLVGDRHALQRRQRDAVARCACADARARARQSRMAPTSELRAARLAIDGFNVLTTLEVALSGGIVLVGCDGAMRDIAGVHGSYRSVQETIPALELIASFVQAHGVAHCTLLLDRPVSNSGRLRALIEQQASERGWPLDSRVVLDPDAELIASSDIVASADGEVLDRCARWFNLARACVDAGVPGARVVDLQARPA